MRRLAALAALVVLLVVGALQVASSRAPSAPVAELAAIAAETDCDAVRLTYAQHHNVWKAGVRFGREEPADLAVMRAALRRLQALVDRGSCDA